MEPPIPPRRLNVLMLVLVAALVGGTGAGAYIAGGRIWRYLTAPPAPSQVMRAYAVIDARGLPGAAAGDGQTVSVRFRGTAYACPLVLDFTANEDLGPRGLSCSYAPGPPLVLRAEGEPLEFAAMPPVDNWTLREYRSWYDASQLTWVTYYRIAPAGAPAAPPADLDSLRPLLRGPNVVRVFGQ